MFVFTLIIHSSWFQPEANLQIPSVLFRWRGRRSERGVQIRVRVGGKTPAELLVDVEMCG